MSSNNSSRQHWLHKLIKTGLMILDLLSPKERRRAWLVLSMVLLMALLDAIGVASVMPFMAVLANPESIETNVLLNVAYTRLGFTDPEQFLFALGSLVLILLIGSLAFKALTTYAQLRFALLREFSISRRMVEGYLHQPYSWFFGRNSAELGKTILSEVSIVVTKGIVPMMSLVAQSAVALVLVILLILIDYKLALVVGLSLAASYGLIFKSMSGLLCRIGQDRINANSRRFSVVTEAFGASKEIKCRGLEQVYINRFSGPAQTYAQHLATSQVVSQLPRFALEGIAFGGMLLVLLYLIAVKGSFVNALPVVVLYAFAGYRLMPALQAIYHAITQLQFVAPALEALHADFMNLQPVDTNPRHGAIVLERAITLDQIQYCYPNAPRPALKSVSLTVPVNSTVGFVGATGSGKTTIVDVILGLLKPQEGTLKIDGQAITESNQKSWQLAIGYVPQHIYLTDDTVAANIAFGVDKKSIDQKAVELAAKVANLHQFVVNELPHQYKTVVGERGVRLSGGQRQRIGIARALYHNPQVLILDEATSALDNLTEKIVMEAVRNIGHEITIIIIAHRLSTVKDCDMIFILENGTLHAQGTFDQLLQTNKLFRSMVHDNRRV